MIQQEKMLFYWQETEDGGARILRVYGETADVVIPPQMEGKKVTEIGAYCFSQINRLPQEGVQITGTADREQLHELSGKYIETISLPDSLQKIGNCAFYNCNKLKEVRLFPGTVEFGSDAFMNCIHLEKIRLCGSPYQKSGLKQMLAQISWNMEVTFGKEKAAEAVILFPEYYEGYDEIGPAHIFELNLTGEGFRARQCFRDGVFLFDQYDGIFPKACVEEPEKVLSKMAVNRLLYPVGLSEESQSLYEVYVLEHQEYVGKMQLKERNLVALHQMIQRGFFSGETVETLLKNASEAGWAEGVASLIQWKGKYLKQDITNEYEFEDF